MFKETQKFSICDSCDSLTYSHYLDIIEFHQFRELRFRCGQEETFSANFEILLTYSIILHFMDV